MDLLSIGNSSRSVQVGLALAGLLMGAAAGPLGYGSWSPAILTLATLPILATLILEIVTSLRRGDFGLDIIAALSMTAALVFGEYLAALVVALMYSGGQFLEAYAGRRARREMTALLSRVPRSAMRHRNGGLEEVALDEIAPADRLLIRNGDVVPADGALAEGIAVLDQSALTGEPLPVRFGPGDELMSGSTNVGPPFDLLVSRHAAESTYAGIVRLVAQAEQSKAPMTRLADRYAIGFLAVTVLLAGGAWYLAGDPIRAVAVLVVATPCPLILAVPVALVAGLSRAAASGILIKGGRALETMALVRALVLDKTGTLTGGQAQLVSIETFTNIQEAELLRLAASLDQVSKHAIARAIADEARTRNLTLSVPGAVKEVAGEGIEGQVDGHAVIVGGRRFVAQALLKETVSSKSSSPGAVAVAVAVDGQLAGELILSDVLRQGTPALLSRLRELGIARIVLATGDRRDVADALSGELGFDEVFTELAPEDKVAIVQAEAKNNPVMMIGDGVNDAPALAAANVGVAMGARGAAASAEAADVVLLVDRLDRIVPALEIAKAARRIALQSVIAGLGLSIAGMIAAALGFITPVQGALLQEAIDVAVILNALRALGISSGPASGSAQAAAA